MYNILFGGAAGDGIETAADLFAKILMRSGFYVFAMRDFMSRIRGGHNFAQIRFAKEPVRTHRDRLDGIVAFNEESFALHKHRLAEGGFVLCDSALPIAHANAVKLELRALAKESGNPKTVGTVCIGALLRLLGIPAEDTVHTALEQTLPPKILAANQKALALGYAAARPHFEATAGNTEGEVLLTGGEAMALGALAGGLGFYTAYPMSPATSLLNFFTDRGAPFGVTTEQAEDEIAAINMALGAAYAGKRAMVGTSGGGFSLMVEALGFAGIAEIPIVMADIQRPGPATGLPTRTEQADLLFVTSAAQGEFPRMVIAVRSHADALYQTARAMRIAWRYQIPVILLGEQYLADAAATLPAPDITAAYASAQLPAARWQGTGEYLRYQLTDDGVSPMMIPGESDALVRIDSDEHDERGVITESSMVRTAMVDKRARKLELLQKELVEPVLYGEEYPDLLLVGFGATEGALAEAVALLGAAGGQKVGALVFGDVFPLPKDRITRYAAKARRVVCVEQNATAQLARLLRQEALMACHQSILKYDGRQISADEIVANLAAGNQ